MPQPLTSPPERKPNHRPKLVADLAEVILAEYNCKRTRSSRLGDKYENLKVLLRTRMSQADLIQLAQLSAEAVVEANHLCHVSAARIQHPGATVPTLKDNTR